MLSRRRDTSRWAFEILCWAPSSFSLIARAPAWMPSEAFCLSLANRSFCISPITWTPGVPSLPFNVISTKRYTWKRFHKLSRPSKNNFSLFIINLTDIIAPNISIWAKQKARKLLWSAFGIVTANFKGAQVAKRFARCASHHWKSQAKSSVGLFVGWWLIWVEFLIVDLCCASRVFLRVLRFSSLSKINTFWTTRHPLIPVSLH